MDSLQFNGRAQNAFSFIIKQGVSIEGGRVAGKHNSLSYSSPSMLPHPRWQLPQGLGNKHQSVFFHTLTSGKFSY